VVTKPRNNTGLMLKLKGNVYLSNHQIFWFGFWKKI